MLQYDHRLFMNQKNDVCSHSSEITQTDSQQKSSHFEMINSENHIVLYIRFERLVRDSYKAKPEIDLYMYRIVGTFITRKNVLHENINC